MNYNCWACCTTVLLLGVDKYFITTTHYLQTKGICAYGAGYFYFSASHIFQRTRMSGIFTSFCSYVHVAHPSRAALTSHLTIESSTRAHLSLDDQHIFWTAGRHHVACCLKDYTKIHAAKAANSAINSKCLETIIKKKNIIIERQQAFLRLKKHVTQHHHTYNEMGKTLLVHRRSWKLY